MALVLSPTRTSSCCGFASDRERPGRHSNYVRVRTNYEQFTSVNALHIRVEEEGANAEGNNLRYGRQDLDLVNGCQDTKADKANLK